MTLGLELRAIETTSDECNQTFAADGNPLQFKISTWMSNR